MKAFLERMPNIKIAYNFHAYGPYWIHPFCFDSATNLLLKNKHAKAKEFYEEASRSIGLDKSYLIGNAAQTIGYRANGEASDYMLS